MTRIHLPLAFPDVFDVTARREISAEPRPGGGGVESFDTDAALEINKARLTHLASLDLPFDGRRVLEVGAGVEAHRVLHRSGVVGHRNRGAS